VGVDVLTNTFATAAQDTLSGMGLGGAGLIGIGGVIVLLLNFLIKFIIFVVLVVIIGERSFSLIHKLPDTVVRWFGGHAENLGESEASHGARGMIIAGAGKAHSLDDSFKTGAAKDAAAKIEKKKEEDRIKGLQQGGSVSQALPQGESGTKDSREI